MCSAVILADEPVEDGGISVIFGSQVGLERVGTAFPHDTSFTFCFKMGLKLFQNGYYLDAFPQTFLLALRPCSQHSCDKIIDVKMALSRMLFSELQKIMVKNVTFFGFRGVIVALDSEVATKKSFRGFAFLQHVKNIDICGTFR